MGRKQIDPRARAKQVSVSMPTSLVEMLDEYCAKNRYKKSAIITAAVEIFFGIGSDGQEGPQDFYDPSQRNRFPPV